MKLQEQSEQLRNAQSKSQEEEIQKEMLQELE